MRKGVVRQDDRHAVMDGGHQLVWRSGDDGGRFYLRPIRRLPMLPQPGKGKRFPGLEPDQVRHLGFTAGLGLPFIKTVRKDKAAVVFICGTERWFLGQRLRACVDEPAADGRILGPGGDQPPDEEIGLVRPIVGYDEHRLGGGNVITRGQTWMGR